MADDERKKGEEIGPSDEEIDSILREIGHEAESTGSPGGEAAPATQDATNIDDLLKELDEKDIAPKPPPAAGPAPEAVLAPSAPVAVPPEKTIRQTPEMLHDVRVKVRIELGRSRMPISTILQLGPGSVVELDKLAGDPLNIYVNDALVARGEVLVLNDNFCVRITEVLSHKEAEEAT